MNRLVTSLFKCIVFIIAFACSNDDCGDEIFIDVNSKNRKVLIIGIDGFRADAMQADISPFLFKLSQRDETYFNNEHLVERLTFSGPNWTSILTGVHVQKHQVRTNDLRYHNLREYPHVFDYIELADSGLNTISVSSWKIINERIVLGNADYAHTFVYNDEEVYNIAKQLLTEGEPIEPNVMFMSFHDLDRAGHKYGFSAQCTEYTIALGRIDTYVEDVISIVNAKRDLGEDWLIMIVSDHGGANKSHTGGYNNYHIRHTVFYANHPSICFKQSHVSSQVDVAPTVLSFLGITSQEFNCKTDGVSLTE
ncbi:alkaline phosphatase family protein [Carboxylicivirga sp. M1479]|uniref:alkaline phosphatase family protein n=1 Tax=Carboxylicivirga sp. M1479 TaxID=2594476 RepID=UPI0011784F0C|nr:alkaline phosphatase family protein [Carboxylicivirga sp. M1479]TRX72147.1 hypothetical protein FNN09_01890 [Carboxylicivirga sp. M1479]